MRVNTINLILEAARRKLCVGHDKDWNSPFLGLGSPSVYKQAVKDGYFTPSFGETPRVLNWYKLTPKGVEAVKSLKLKPSDFHDFNFSGNYSKVCNTLNEQYKS